MANQESNFRVRAYAALGDSSRLAIVDLLANRDLASGELTALLGVPTNLMAHHLGVLQEAGLITRRHSEGDGRRTYVTRTRACSDLIGPGSFARPRRVAFLCSQNSARSQLAESFWRSVSDIPVISGGTHPAARVHPRAVAVARRHGLDLAGARPRLAAEVLTDTDLVVAVCDRAYEDIGGAEVHWSIPDPARAQSPAAFDAAFDEISGRIARLVDSFEGESA